MYLKLLAASNLKWKAISSREPTMPVPAIGTLVEHTTHLVVLVKLPHPNPATAAHVLQAFNDKLGGIAQPMRKSLTYDRGREVAGHAQT
jgi:IS30 family transposase